jgi:hypothetical protein
MPLCGSQEQTMTTTTSTSLDGISTRNGLVLKTGRLDPGAVLRRWWRRLFGGARNGLPA